MIKENLLKQLNKQIKSTKYVGFSSNQILGKFLKILRMAIKIVFRSNSAKEQDLDEPEPTLTVQRVKVVSKTSVPPGKILIFNYTDEDGRVSIRKVLTVNCARSLGGTHFVSTKDNDLLSAYDLNNVTAELLVEILEKLLDNTEACTYQRNPTDLIQIVPTLEPNEFRTFNVDEMTGTHYLKITKQK